MQLGFFREGISGGESVMKWRDEYGERFWDRVKTKNKVGILENG